MYILKVIIFKGIVDKYIFDKFILVWLVYVIFCEFGFFFCYYVGSIFCWIYCCSFYLDGIY